MSTEVEIYSAAPLPDRWNYAQAMATAGSLVPKGMQTGGQPDPGKIFFTFETGAMLGIHPVAAIQGVNVIEGKPTLSPELMSAVVRRAGHKLRVSVSGDLKDLSLQATAQIIRHDDPDFTFEAVWTIEKARQAGLLGVVNGEVRARSERGTPLPWEKYTAAMLKARAISEVCREGATEALMGVSYVPEELGATVNEAGEIVQLEEGGYGVQPETRRPAPSAQDYRPIALADTPATPTATAPVSQDMSQDAPVVTVVETPTPDIPYTDMDIVQMYQLESLATVIQAQQVFLLARQNGHLDRLIEGKPLAQWLTDLAAVLEQVDASTGEVLASDGDLGQDAAQEAS